MLAEELFRMDDDDADFLFHQLAQPHRRGIRDVGAVEVDENTAAAGSDEMQLVGFQLVEMYEIVFDAGVELDTESGRLAFKRLDRLAYPLESAAFVVGDAVDEGDSLGRRRTKDRQRCLDIFRSVADAERQMTVNVDHLFVPSVFLDTPRNAAQKLKVPSVL